MQLTAEQKRASSALLEYAMHPSSAYVAMAGYAGTGKTTVMSATARKILMYNPSASIAFTAPTGKAADVLRQKLQDADAFGRNCSAGTMHKLMYGEPHYDEYGRLVWTPVKDIDCDIVVVDEASMVNESLYNHILGFGKPVIFVGDSGQLPPVKGDLFEPLQETDIRLTEVHRQALDNPIIKLATDIRSGEPMPGSGTKLGDSVIILKKNSEGGLLLQRRFLRRTYGDDCIALCGTNKLRVENNKNARKLQMLDADMPQVGDKVMCLINDNAAGLFNGQIFRISDIRKFIGEDSLYIARLDGMPKDYLVWPNAFNVEDVEALHLFGRKVSEGARKRMYITGQFSPIAMDYAYCISVHKSQGSEWDNVLLFANDGVFLKKGNDNAYMRWLYTGITRAKKKLIILL